MIFHRLQLPGRRLEDRNGRGPVHPPAPHRGPCPLPRHNYRNYRPNTLVCIFAPPATRRSYPWRSSSTILGPITKRAGSLSNTASNDALCIFLSFFSSACHRPLPVFHPASFSRRSASHVHPIFFPLDFLWPLQTPGPGIYHHIDTSFSLHPLPTNSHPSSCICSPITQSHAPRIFSCLVLL